MNELVKNKETSIEIHSYGEFSGTGFEETTSSDLSIPFLNLLQSNSPIVQNAASTGDDSYKAGMIMNSVTGERSTSFNLIPIHKEESWVEWKDRSAGGGLVESHRPDSDLVKEIIAKNKGSRINPKDAKGKKIPFFNGENEVIETHYLYCLVLNKEGDDTQGFAVIPFSSTKIKTLKDFMTCAYLIKGKPPIFANRIKLSSEYVSKPQNSYYSYRITPLKTTYVESLINPKTEDKLLKEAIDFRESIMSGVAKVDYSKQSEDAVSGGSTPTDENIPF